MNVERTSLPGIGLRHTFTTSDGRSVGVVTHHAGGRRELIHDDPSDPDGVCSLSLTRAEAVALAGLLGILDVVDVVIATSEVPTEGGPGDGHLAVRPGR